MDPGLGVAQEQSAEKADKGWMSPGGIVVPNGWLLVRFLGRVTGQRTALAKRREASGI